MTSTSCSALSDAAGRTLRRRYDRETDSFVDVDPFAAPPEEE
ncbi:hypothetical protein [Bradyrhizobium sp. RDM4]